MKKLLFLFATLLAFTACSSSDDKEMIDPNKLPISGLELPVPAEGEMLKAGNELTIKGKGFNEASQIWLKAVTPATRVLEGGVQAEVKSFSDAELVFVVPEVYGAHELFLGQGERMFPLGTLEFAEKATPKAVKRLEGAFSKSNDVYSFDFTYNAEGNVESISILQPWWGNSRVVNYNVLYNESAQIVAITAQLEGKKIFMNDGRVTYPSENTVAINNIASEKRYTYTLNQLGRVEKVADSRNDKVDKFVYDEVGNLLTYTEISYGNKPEDNNCKYDDKVSAFAAVNLPDWAWHFILVDILSANTHMYSLSGINNVTDVAGVAFSYEYNDANQPTVILADGKKIGSVVYND